MSKIIKIDKFTYIIFYYVMLTHSWLNGVGILVWHTSLGMDGWTFKFKLKVTL